MSLMTLMICRFITHVLILMHYQDNLVNFSSLNKVLITNISRFQKRLEEFSTKCSALHRDKEEAHANISNLTDALNEKKRDIESLTNELER